MNTTPLPSTPADTPTNEVRAITDADIGPVLISGLNPPTHSAEERKEINARRVLNGATETLEEYEAGLFRYHLSLREGVVTVLNSLIRRRSYLEPIVREQLRLVQKRVAGFPKNDRWNLMEQAAGSSPPFHADFAGTPEVGLRRGNFAMRLVLPQLGVNLEDYDYDDEWTCSRLVFRASTSDSEIANLAVHYATGIGYRLKFLTNATITEVRTKQGATARPNGEKEKALEILQSLAAKGPVAYSDWISEIAARQPGDKDDTARKKLARTYAKRLIEDGAVKRDEDGLVSVLS